MYALLACPDAPPNARFGAVTFLQRFGAVTFLQRFGSALNAHTLASIAVLLGGLGILVPGKRDLIARLGLKAVAAGSLSNLMSAALAGLLLGLRSGAHSQLGSLACGSPAGGFASGFRVVSGFGPRMSPEAGAANVSPVSYWKASFLFTQLTC